MGGNTNNRKKQRFANKNGWNTNSNQNNRIGIPSNISRSQIISKKTNTIIKDDNNIIRDTKELVVIQNQLSKIGGPSHQTGMFGTTADSVVNKIYYNPKIK